MSSSMPLVSIIIYNYNYGRFLRACLESVVAQSYPNIEVLFSDNASTDDSWEIACEFSRVYPHQFFLAKNRQNFGQTANFKNCFTNVRGKYFLVLGSDDSLNPNYVAKAVLLMEQNPDAGLAIVHRAILDASNQVHEETPFYNQTCKIPAPKQAAVYMMATVNPSITQAFYRSQYAINLINLGGTGSRFHGARILDFDLACHHAVIYIKESLVFHRVHGHNDASQATQYLMDVLGAYVMNFDFQEKANALNLPEISNRLDASIEKNANLALRYAIDSLKKQNIILAERYVHLAFALHPDVQLNQLYQELLAFFNEIHLKDSNLDSKQPNGSIQKKIEKIIASTNGVTRSISYDPPEGSLALE